jgi:AcrR family transcriptional regulator
MNMSSRKKRIYVSESRQVQAVQTRTRILESAKQLFQTKGFEKVTIDQLAQAAGVSAPTIYALFQSKRGVLCALMNEALPPQQYEALVRQAVQEKSVAVGLAMAAKIARQLYDAEQAQMDIFRGAPLLAPELKELEQEREQRRYKRLEESIKRIAEKDSLEKGLSLPKAHDILWAFTGRDMYRLFVIERGWSSDEYEEWLSQLLIKTLIGDDK